MHAGRSAETITELMERRTRSVAEPRRIAQRLETHDSQGSRSPRHAAGMLVVAPAAQAFTTEPVWECRGERDLRHRSRATTASSRWSPTATSTPPTAPARPRAVRQPGDRRGQHGHAARHPAELPRRRHRQRPRPRSSLTSASAIDQKVDADGRGRGPDACCSAAGARGARRRGGELDRDRQVRRGSNRRRVFNGDQPGGGHHARRQADLARRAASARPTTSCSRSARSSRSRSTRRSRGATR